MSIYILQLKSDKYYIGSSNNFLSRINDHFTGNGSEWTKLYSPIAVINIINSISMFDEDNITKEHMMKYGIDNVRGGSYSNIILSKEQISCLNREFDTILKRCFRCHRTSHWTKQCYAKTYEDGSLINENLCDYLCICLEGIIIKKEQQLIR